MLSLRLVVLNDRRRILATEAMESVGDLLGSFEGQQGQEGQRGLKTETSNPFQTQEVAV